MKAKIFSLLLLFLLPTLSAAGEVFDGLETYYATLPGQLFPGEGQRLEQFFLVGDDDTVRLRWSGHAAGHEHTVGVHDGVMTIDRHRFKPKTIRMFPGQTFSEFNLGLGTRVYFAKGWACLDSTSMTASGRAVRYKSVYLVKLAKKNPTAWKLPNLLASCGGIRLQDNQIEFDKIDYRGTQDDPRGLVFTTYVIRNGKFVPTGRIHYASLVEPGNVYKFQLD
jgi:hypothetical protein